MSILSHFKKILVVEDDSALRKALVAKIEHEGFHVIETDKGTDAVRLILTEKPNLIVLDLMLPGRDGMSILETMRGEEWDNKTPVIILTNLSGHGGLQEDAAKLNAKYFDKASTDIQVIVDEIKKSV